MLGVLQIVLGQNPVAAAGCVARQLLVFVEHVLGVAAHLDPLGTIGVERAVGVVLLWLVATAAAAAIATALPFHALEVSHMRPWSWALGCGPAVGFLEFPEIIAFGGRRSMVLKNEVIPRLPPSFDAFSGVSQRHPFRRMVRRDLMETP